MKPTRAILLAAGRGMRQRPHTDTLPKPLLPVDGRNALDFTLEAVARADIRDVCIVTHYLEAQIRDFVGAGSRWGLRAVFAHQDALRGSGDAVLTARDAQPGWRDHSAPVLVAATDYILPLNALVDLVSAHESGGCDITVGLKACPPEELSARSSVALGPGWRVTRIVEKPGPSEAPGPYTASLVYILPPQVWDALRRVPPSPRGEVELPDAVNLLIENGMSAYGLLQPTPREWEPQDLKRD